ncbi:MAG TPA: tRNA (adenosine(37)-N6)-threonylcarbamoyltransferase complex ATPase subunit type 1 TsaE [Stellaceae bacterium]|nr:tRNA (adenosine(37)-N6)-threonylcarbamoyltransferase complex ATPase subunit type 1 TsaE [Stellaceae bacterium]
MPEALPISLTLGSESATEALAGRLAGAVQPGDVVALSGPLGIGKSVFARAFVRALAGADEEVPSPTFTLVQGYDTPAGTVWHFDLYRLTVPEEALEIGFEEALGDLAVLIEWPERLGPLLPVRRLDVMLAEGATPESRVARIAGRGGGTLAVRASL